MLEARRGVGAAEENPVDELLRGRLARLHGAARVGELALAREPDRLLHRGKFGRQRDHRRFGRFRRAILRRVATRSFARSLLALRAIGFGLLAA